MDISSLPTISAGFPSPAESFFERSLDIADLLVQHKDFTFFLRVEGNSMVGAGIHDRDILVVDRSLDAVDNSIIVAVLNGNFTVKRIGLRGQEIVLLAEHPRYPSLKITEHDSFSIWGVVTYSIHALGSRLTRGPVVASHSQLPPQR